MIRVSMLCAALLVTAAPALAAPEETVYERDPATMSALSRLGAALRAQPNAEVHVAVTTEDVLMSGQKVQFGGSVDMLVSRPNKMMVQLKVGQSERQIYYDGKNVTLYAPQQNFYAVFAAPPTIRETLELASEKYGLEIPLADMAAWGTDAELEARVVSAFPLGKETIGGHVCDHHVIRGQVLDWQVWIREGDPALPCKLVITDRADPTMPQYTAVYDWRLSPAIDPAAFTFSAPEGAKQIIIRPQQGAIKTAGN